MEAVGLIEIGSWSASVAALDAIEKAGNVRLIQVEQNDLAGTIVKITGDPADVRTAIDAGRAVAEQMHAKCVVDVINALDDRAIPAMKARPEFNPLMEQPVVHDGSQTRQQSKEHSVSQQLPYALGMIETQGFIAVIEAIDTACKAAAVEVVGREKLGGGYITVMIKGDVAAVKAAVDAGRQKVEGLGKLIAAHVIARPSAAIASLLPK